MNVKKNILYSLLLQSLFVGITCAMYMSTIKREEKKEEPSLEEVRAMVQRANSDVAQYQAWLAQLKEIAKTVKEKGDSRSVEEIYHELFADNRSTKLNTQAPTTKWDSRAYAMDYLFE